MQDGNAKQLVTDRVKNSTNILVTVSANPSVDELSAALGLTLLLNKMDKHATAVFSGTIPPAITFLEPAKTFESTTDSLRDFIIALDKEKADRLRYKVEDNVVRIFITPYKTTITSGDLEFSQGDFNVELIIALGVEKKEDLDTAIVAHGKILHDATVVTVNAGNQTSGLGSVDWHDQNASSLCEMLVSISESFGSGLLDQQIANALLTGIVAATERFRNNLTSPKVMTMAAQLMAAGANQQLIATKLEEGNVFSAGTDDGSTPLTEGASSKLKKTEQANNGKVSADGALTIEHIEDSIAAVKSDAHQESAADEANDLANRAEEERLSKTLETAKPALAAPEGDIKSAIEADTAAAVQSTSKASSWKGREIQPPTMGSALSATSEEALKSKLAAEEEDKNHTILSHDSGPAQSGLSGNVGAPAEDDEGPSKGVGNSFIVGATPEQRAPEPVALPAPEPVISAPEAPPSFHEETLEDIERETHSSNKGKTLADIEREAHAHAEAVAQPTEEVQSAVDQARNAVAGALFDDKPQNVSETPAAPPEFTLPPLPDMSTLPPLPPGVDDIANLPPTPQEGGLDQATQQAPVSNDPGQFKIPGQS